MPAIKKEKKLRTLPAEYKGIVFQPNRITNAKYDYSLIQERIFNAIICKLREQINDVMHGMPVKQLGLFKEENILITLPLMAIAKPSYYNKVRKTLSEMSQIPVEIPKTYKGQEGVILDGLLAVWTPTERSRSGELIIKIERYVAEQLLTIDRNIQGQPIHYTSYLVDVCLHAKNKYTPRIYKFISSWKSKGGTYITLDNFREMLQLGEKYKTYRDIKKRILRPVSAELKEIADCWFNCSDENFLEKQGKSVVGLRFKIIKTNSNLHYVKLWHDIKYLLSVTEFQLKAFHINQLEYLPLERATQLEDVHNAIKRIHQWYYNPEHNRYREKADMAAVLVSSLKKEFPPIPIETTEPAQ